MNRIYRITAIVAGFAGVLLAVTITGPAAFAAQVPASGGATGVTPAPQAPIRIDTVGGMAGWQITLIALAAALFAATAAVFIDRIRTARQRVSTTNA
jgi:hypothetical protein